MNARDLDRKTMKEKRIVILWSYERESIRKMQRAEAAKQTEQISRLDVRTILIGLALIVTPNSDKVERYPLTILRIFYTKIINWLL